MTSPRSHEHDLGQVLLVRKPAGWTSFDVVRKVRHMLGVKKVGHSGTLDPMATGLLIVCTGKKTREVGRYQDLEKEYHVRMILGARTESFDAEAPITEQRSIEGITEEKIHAALRAFVGPQVQVPPMWSAAKIGGKRLYKLARKGEVVERKRREIFIRAITPTEIRLPEVAFTVVCSKGTYVRALVNDIGEWLGCGAYVSALERTRIGEFSLNDALSIDELAGKR